MANIIVKDNNYNVKLIIAYNHIESIEAVYNIIVITTRTNTFNIQTNNAKGIRDFDKDSILIGTYEKRKN